MLNVECSPKRADLIVDEVFLPAFSKLFQSRRPDLFNLRETLALFDRFEGGVMAEQLFHFINGEFFRVQLVKHLGHDDTDVDHVAFLAIGQNNVYAATLLVAVRQEAGWAYVIIRAGSEAYRNKPNARKTGAIHFPCETDIIDKRSAYLFERSFGA